MKSEDLRIGNLVDKGSIYGIEPITAYELSQYDLFLKGGSVAEYYSEWKPISLNVSFFEKFEFKAFPWGWVREGCPLIRIGLLDNTLHFWCELGNGFKVVLPYVHTLQNFISLVGIELTLK